ncbi:MAG: hypothetical protein ACPLVI_08235, partial [Thermoplasmata archaeon]
WNPDQYPGTTGNFVLGATVRPDWNYNIISGIYLNINGINGILASGYNLTKPPNPPPQIPELYGIAGDIAVDTTVEVIGYLLEMGEISTPAGLVAGFAAEGAFILYNSYAAYFDYGYNLQSTADINSAANVWLTLLTTGAKNSYGIYQYSGATDIQVGIPANYIKDGLVYTVTPYVSIYYNVGSGIAVYKYENITFTPSGIEISDGGHGIISYTNINAGGLSGGSGGSSGSCVYGLEPILMTNGKYKLAEDIRVGDKIMTYNFTINSGQFGKVTKIEISNESEMYIINGILYLAPDQYVWTERGWIMAKNITYNDTIYNIYTGCYDQVSSIIILNGTYRMYDFTVDINGDYLAFAYILKDLGGIHAC